MKGMHGLSLLGVIPYSRHLDFLTEVKLVPKN